jgi:hypothetical protein
MLISGDFGSIFPSKLPKVELEALRNGALAPDACFLTMPAINLKCKGPRFDSRGAPAEFSLTGQGNMCRLP